MTWRSVRLRIRLCFVASCYVASFIWGYKGFLVPVWGYWGFLDVKPPVLIVALAITLASLPALWLPIRFTQPTHFVYWAIYLVVHVPSMIVPLYSNAKGLPIVPLMLTMFAGFALIGLSYVVPRLRLRSPGVSRPAFWIVMAIVVACLIINVLWVYGRNIHLVTFTHAAEVRFAAREIEAGIAGYTSFWLAFGLNPLLMAFGLVRRRWIPFIVGVAGQILIYSMLAMKSVALSIVILPALLVILRNRNRLLGLRIVWAATLVVAFTSAATAIIRADTSALFSKALYIPNMLLARTLGIPGLNTLQYFDLFTRRGFTYWSHVRGISSFIAYPYERSLPYQVGLEFYNNPELSANAHFFATDGLAAAGLPGVIVIALVCGLVFWTCDVLAQRHDPVFVSLCLAGPAMALLNVGLFTTLLTDGLALIILTLYLLPAVTMAPRRMRTVRTRPLPPQRSPDLRKPAITVQ